MRIAGSALACALGSSLEECVQGLSQGLVRTVPLTLEGLEEPVRMPYYRIPDPAADIFDPARLEALLPPLAEQALRAAGLGAAQLRSLPVFVGSSAFSVTRSEALYADELAQGAIYPCALPLVDFQHLATLLKRSLGVGGESYAYNTACSAGANALLGASRMLALGRHRHALVIGMELANRTTLAGFSGLQLVAPSLKPFDRQRSGIVLGEGLSAVVLSADAGPGLRFLGGATNCDTYSVTTANPDGSSIAAVQAEALRLSGVAKEKVVAIKAHGTASPMNDQGEAAGILRLFPKPPPIFAFKSYTGHTLGACGVNELVLTAAALLQGFLPATPGFEEEDPALKLGPLRAKLAAPKGPMVLNYFGFGGNNTSLVVEAP